MPELWRITYITTADHVTQCLRDLPGHVTHLELNPVEGMPEPSTRVVPAERRQLPALINGRSLEPAPFVPRENSARDLMLQAIRAANGRVVTTKQLHAVLKRAGRSGTPSSLGLLGLIENGLIKRIRRSQYVIGDGSPPQQQVYKPRPGTAAYILLELCRKGREVTAQEYAAELKKHKKSYDTTSITNLIRHGLIKRTDWGRYAAVGAQ